MLEAGAVAPEIELSDKDGNIVRLSDFKGKKVVVYFYPKDNTPGCTREACAFRDHYGEFGELGVVVIGISKDSTASHQKFVTSQSLPFILLSDPEKKAIMDYDVWQEKKMYGKVTFCVSRSTNVIDENGVIEKVYKRANPDTNAEDILKYLRG